MLGKCLFSAVFSFVLFAANFALADMTEPSPSPSPSPSASMNLAESAAATYAHLSQTLQTLQMDQGQWQGPIEADPSADIMPALLSHELGFQHANLAEETLQRVFGRQENGLWPAYPGGPASADVTAAIVIGLKHAGLVQEGDPRLAQAEKWLADQGGAEKQLGPLNRLILVFSGALPEDQAPGLSPNFLAFPQKFPVNAENIGFGRSGIIPFVIWEYYKDVERGIQPPAHPLDPARLQSAGAAFGHPFDAPIRLGTAVREITHGEDHANFHDVMAVGQAMLPTSPEFWAQEALGWTLAHQQPDGTWAGALQITYFSMFALTQAQKMGVGDFSKQIAKAWEGLMGWRVGIPEGMVIQQSTEGPVMDTARILTGYALAPQAEQATLDPARKQKALEWLLDHQIFEGGDWQRLAPKVQPGGWTFEYWNSPYPDCDDTGMVLESLVRSGQTPGIDAARVNNAIDRGLGWLLGLQNKDGGFPTWDRDTSGLFTWLINHPSIYSLPEVNDISQSDITSRVIRGLVAIRDLDPSSDRAKAIKKPLKKACHFLVKKRVKTSDTKLKLWQGEWMVNYTYGTAQSVSALLAAGYWDLGKAAPYIEWLISKQQSNGGWGESPESYPQKHYVEATPTLTQTEIVLDTLIEYEKARGGTDDLPSARAAIDAGIQYLVTRIGNDDFPREEEFTGVYVRGVWYGRYLILPHYEALRTLGMYLGL